MVVQTNVIDRLLKRWDISKACREQDSAIVQSIVPIITVSTMTGSHSHQFAAALAQRLGYEVLAVKDIEQFAPGSDAFVRVCGLLDPQFKSSLPELVDSIAVHLSDQPDIVRHHCAVVLSLAELGDVILLDWAANHILGPDGGLHIRIWCPNSIRGQNAAKESGLPVREARNLLREAYSDGYAFLLKQLRYGVWEESQYDLVLNTGHIGAEELADVAVAAAKAKAISVNGRRPGGQPLRGGFRYPR